MYQPNFIIKLNRSYNATIQLPKRATEKGFMLQHNVENLSNNDGVTGSGYRYAERLNCNTFEEAVLVARAIVENKGGQLLPIAEQPQPTPQPQPQKTEQPTEQKTESKTTKEVEVETLPQPTPQPQTPAISIVDVEQLIKKEIAKVLQSKSETKSEPQPQSIVEPTTASYQLTKKLVKEGVNVYMYGPAGCGKNYQCELLAKSLNLDFYFSAKITDETQLIGYNDIKGNYVETEFYKAYKSGGLFMLDEIDASFPDCTTVLNSALANGYFPFPNGTIKQHPNFHIIAAGNTVGLGATEQYTTRNVLSAEFRDRFVFIEVGYNTNDELMMVNNNVELVKFIDSLRLSADNLQTGVLITYRALRTIAKIENFIDTKTAVKLALLKGEEKQTWMAICDNISEKNNRYTEALATAINEL